MPEITIHPKIKIFDDPEFCSLICSYSKFRKNSPEEHYIECILFGDYMDIQRNRKIKKCPECKTYYNQAKEKNESKNPT